MVLGLGIVPLSLGQGDIARVAPSETEARRRLVDEPGDAKLEAAVVEARVFDADTERDRPVVGDAPLGRQARLELVELLLLIENELAVVDVEDDNAEVG